MPRISTYLHALNVGVQDKKHLPRVDLERMRLAAETQTNLIPLTSGPAFMRPGLQFLTTTASNNVCRLKEFVFGATDAALLEFTDQAFRVKVNDVLVTRPAVTAVVATGDFSSDTNWTKTATAGATVTISGGYLNLTALARGSRASASQTVTVNEIGTEHALRIVIERGPVTLRVGSTSGGDEYINETILRTGTHSLAFTPSGASFYILFQSEDRNLKRVDSITIEAAGIMSLPTIWLAADLDKMRFAQSADVVFIACAGYRPQRIERRSTRSWSVVRYQPNNGPFTLGTTRDVSLTPSVTEGNGTLTASGPFFDTDHVGTLFSLSHEGFKTRTRLAGNDQYTDAFKVTGINGGEYSDRDWDWTLSGTWSGTLRWYRSFDSADQGYKRFRKAKSSVVEDITANEGPTQNGDSDDNAIIWYKFGLEGGAYTSGTVVIDVNYDGGFGSGVCRVVGYTSPTQVDIEILSAFHATTASKDWRECEWSQNQIWPSAVTFAEGRLWWSGSDRIWGSVSDGFEDFDDETEGDSGPISRSIATGGVNDTQWLLPLQRLLVGTEGAVSTVKSSSFDEPLTPTNLTIKDSSSTGAASIDPARVDSRGLFVDRSGKALFELSFDGQSSDYNATQMSKLATDLFASGVKALSVQRRPDTRIWIIMNDGSCVCTVYEPLQEVLAFIPVVTDGSFESVAVLPAADQDRVYFVVNRTINGSTVRYVEKMALDTEVKPTTLCKVMDAFKSGVNSPASTMINVGTHLIGESVVVWADGAPLVSTANGYTEPNTYTVDGSGNITVGSPVTNWVAGLPYSARYKSSKLAYGAAQGTAMLQKKKVDEVGLIMTDFVRAGIRYGSQFDNDERPLFPMPINEGFATAPAIVLSDINDEEPFVFSGEFNTDSRVCIECASPNTMTLISLVLTVTTNG
ncbi:hypothetical protein [Mesorhizobium sp. Root172]|uniref:hypothetical protein n=1 Tax=Mesorhizobium sp. Root172 TaxID=1736481 RepID=UPI0006F41031|nr:hypothetical protein [Mesorhizobium sp. Root172]KRB22676.1 hypothetical protein ASE05_15945 [Mesorhizobium sp. Root172]